MTSFPFDIVGFDLDGTLLDTSFDLGHALNHALSLAGRAPVPLADVRRFVGGGTRQMLRNAMAETGGVDEDALPALQDSLVEYYGQNIAAHTVFYPGGEAMLDALEAQGVTLAIATNKLEHLALRLFREMGLLDRFACVIGGDTMGKGKAKPAPDMLHEMVARCGGGRAAYVGDTTFDIGAAKAAGLPVVACSFGFNDMPVHDLGADAVIDHFDELVPALLRLG